MERHRSESVLASGKASSEPNGDAAGECIEIAALSRLSFNSRTVHAGVAPHIKWFTDPAAHPTDWSLLLSLPVIIAFVVALGAVGAAYVIQHRVVEPKLMKTFERFASVAPAVLGLNVGVALAASALLGVLFSPNLRPNDDLLGHAILAIEAMCGLMLLLGLATRPGSILLALLGVLAMQPFTFESILENVHILGIAIFLFIVGRGPLSLDRIRRVKPPTRHKDAPTWALTLLRVCLGFSIAFTALTEKLLDPGLAKALLDQKPFLNIARPFGIDDPQFAFLAGLTELVIGMVVLSGQLTRPAMAIGAVLFTMTVPLFGWSELLGHLPFYGIMFVLFIAPNADAWRAKRSLRPAA